MGRLRSERGIGFLKINFYCKASKLSRVMIIKFIFIGSRPLLPYQSTGIIYYEMKVDSYDNPEFYKGKKAFWHYFAGFVCAYRNVHAAAVTEHSRKVAITGASI